MCVRGGLSEWTAPDRPLTPHCPVREGVGCRMEGTSSRALRAAIVGCGRMGGLIDDEVRDYPGVLLPYGHAGAYVAAPGVDLVAAADIDAGRLRQFADRFGIPEGFTDYREMLAVVRPDIVSITTQTVGRAQVARDAVAAGVRAIYCEKAFACSLAEADDLVAACRAAGVTFNIGTSRRYDPGYRTARALLAAGELGAPRLAVAYAPGHLMHTHSHTIDTLLYLLGDPEVEEVQGQLAVPAVAGRRLPEDPPLAWAQFRCVGGARGVLLAAPGRYEFEVVGTEGGLLASNNGHTATWALRRPGPLRQGGMGVWEIAPFPEHDRSVSATLRAVTELAEAVRTGTPTSGGTGVALRQMEVGVAIAESHLRGGTAVALPLPDRDLYIPSR